MTLPSLRTTMCESFAATGPSPMKRGSTDATPYGTTNSVRPCSPGFTGTDAYAQFATSPSARRVTTQGRIVPCGPSTFAESNSKTKWSPGRTSMRGKQLSDQSCASLCRSSTTPSLNGASPFAPLRRHIQA